MKTKTKTLLKMILLGMTLEGKLFPGSNSEWTLRRCPNSLRTDVTRTKTELKKQGFVESATKTTRQCVANNDYMQCRIKCAISNQLCFTADLYQF